MGTRLASNVAGISQHNQDRIIAVATIVAPSGIKGWLKLHSDFGPPDLLCKVSPWLLAKKDSEDWRVVRVETVRLANGRMQVKLAGVDGREEAQSLVGMTIGVNRSLMPALPEGEYYWCDLVGLQVINEAREPLGKIACLLSTPANDLLEISSESGNLWIPFKDPYLVNVDFESGNVMVRWQLDY